MIRTAAGFLVAVLLAALLAAAWLLATTAGSRWLAARAEAELPGLEVTVAGGSLWQGLALRDVAWDGGGVRLRAAALGFSWRPLCLLDARVCVDRLGSEGLQLDVAPPPERAADGDAGEPPARLSLPVTILLRAVELRNTRVHVPGAEVSLTRLSSSATLAGDRLRVGETRLAGLDVRLPAAEAQGSGEGGGGEASAPPGPSPRQAIALPEVRLPLAIDLEGLKLAQASLQRGDQSWPLDRLEVAGRFADGVLDLERLSASSPRGEAELTGLVTLRGEWPLALDLQARAEDLLQGEAVALRARLRRSVADLGVDLTLEAPVAARLQAEVTPLAIEPAWQATLNAARLPWPLDGDPTVIAEGVEVTASGQGTAYRVDAAVGVSGPGIPSGRYRIDLEGDATGADILGLDGRLLDGRVGLTGQVGWREGVRWDLALALGGINPGQWREGLQGRLGGQVRVRGEAAAGAWSMRAEVPGVAGRLRDYPFSLSGTIAGGSSGAWRFDGVRLVSGGNEARLEGRAGDSWDARLALDMPALDRLWPGLGGSLRGEVALGGALASPDIRADLTGANLVFQDVAAETLTLEGVVRERFEADSRLRLVAEGLSRADESLGRLEAVLEGRRGRHGLTLAAANGPLPLSLRLEGGLSAALDAWEGRLASAQLTLPEGQWRLAEAAALGWRASDQRVTLAAHCWQRDDARLCATEALRVAPGSAMARLRLENYPLAAADPWLPGGLGLEGTLSGEAAVDWAGGATPQVTGSLGIGGGAVLLAGVESDETVRFGWRRIDADLQLAPDAARLALSFDSEAFGSGELEARVNPGATPRRLTGEVRLGGVELAPLAAFLPQLRDLQGRLEASGRLGGTLTAPAFDGELRLVDGRVVLRGLASPIEDITLSARVSGSQARLDGSFRAGEGEARLTGELGWGAGLAGALQLQGEALELRLESLARVRVSPDLRIELAPERLAVSGEVAVPWARIRIRELPAGAVPVSDDVVIVDDEVSGDPEASDTEAGDEAAQPSGGWSIETDIRVLLGDDVRFEGFGAEGRLAGGLRLRQVGTDATEAEGEVRFEEGRFSAYGQRLEIRRGRFLFAGPISNPQLDIEAIRRVETVVAGLRVGGTAEDPQVSLFSEPTMPQADILTYLITGRPPGSGSPSEDALVAQAALSLGLFGGRNIGGALAEELGVEDFQLETSGQGAETNVAVSGYIAPNLLVSYGVGVFQPQNTLTLRYYLTERLFVEAVSGAENALDLFYSFDF